MANNLLPTILDDDHYSALFKQNSIWEPAIETIMKIHRLAKPAVRAPKGTHIVYRVGDIWIKLMAPIYAGDMDFEIACLKAIDGQLNFATPRVLSEGELESWRYVLISHVDGERVGDHFQQLSVVEQVNLAVEFAQATRAIHKISVPQIIAARGDWNQFIRGQYDGVYETHRKRNMAEVWLRNLTSFVHKFPISEFTLNTPVFLHADLTWDHFLIKNEKGRWRLSGIIDFADAQCGHPEYDMCASMAFLFRHKREVITAYAHEMGMRETGKTLSHKLLVWTLLHRFSNLKNYFAQEMLNRPTGDFEKLAEEVYPAN